MTRLTTTLPLFAVLFLSALQPFSLSAFSQSVRWEPSGGSLAKGQTSQIQLVFENCQPQGETNIPTVAGLELQHNGSRSNNFSTVNGRMTSSISFGFNARPTTDARILIPAFSINTDKGPVTVPSATFDVGAATVPNQGGQVTLDQITLSRITAPKTAWMGEVIPLTYTFAASKRFFGGLASEPEWDAAPLVAEPLPKSQQVNATEQLRNGEQWVVLNYPTHAMARAPGEIALNAAKQTVGLGTGPRDAFAAFFGRSTYDQYTIGSDRPDITVKPLPAGAPKSFAGAVGKFTLDSKIVPASATVGEPITWTLTLAGAGNWPDIAGLPSRSVSKDFRPIQSPAKRTPAKENGLFDVTLTEDVVLVPTKPGAYTLGPVEWTYFDPAQGRYITITTPATTVNITGVVAPAGAGFHPGAAPGASQQTSSAASLALPKQPGEIPGDPLPASAPASTPLSWNQLTVLLLVCGLWPLALWLVFAFLRARRTDPGRPQREARARIRKILAALDETPAAEHARIASLLQQWQHATAVLWKIPQVVPSASQFLKARDQKAGAVWSALWSESERTLYRTGTPLPIDWVARALDALAAKRAPAFNPLSLFRARNLFPLAAALALFLSALQPFGPSAFGATKTTETAQTPEAAYKSGDFKTAEAAWRLQAAAAPADWTARHNLSLALAQQDRWAEAGAQAVAAFVQNPSEPETMRNMLYTLGRAGYAPGAIADVMRAGPAREVAFAISPAQWQCVLGCAVALAALAFALLVVRAYVRRRRLVLAIVAGIFLASAMFGATVSVLSLRAYGAAKDSRAVIVWKAGSLRSIPTVADTTQKTTPLAAGTIAVADKTFPGWVRLVFDNGQTGWAPKEEVVALWK